MGSAADIGPAPYCETLCLSSRLITPAGVQDGKKNVKRFTQRGAPHEPLSPLFTPLHTTALSCVLPEEDQEGNIWICSEGCNFRSSSTLLIPSQCVVYFGPVLWSIARFLRSNHQVTGTDTVRPYKAEGDLAGMAALFKYSEHSHLSHRKIPTSQ